MQMSYIEVCIRLSNICYFVHCSNYPATLATLVVKWGFLVTLLPYSFRDLILEQ